LSEEEVKRARLKAFFGALPEKHSGNANLRQLGGFLENFRHHKFLKSWK
jgi:hypothetical protein